MKGRTDMSAKVENEAAGAYADDVMMKASITPPEYRVNPEGRIRPVN